jgi:hypothetical protein
VRNKTFYVTIDLGDIFLSLTEKALGNHKLLDVGISGQKISLVKKSKTMKINAFGIVIDTYYSLDKVYSYGLMFLDSGSVYGGNLALQLSTDQYTRFIKDIKRVQSLYPNYTEKQT